MPDKYAVIGNPVEHSLSPVIHAAFARETGADIAYGRILAPRDGFRAAVLAFRAEGGRGLNVTLPFKREAWELCEAREAAVDAQAVNTVKFDGARMLGYNTDGVGLVRDLRQNLGCAIAGRRALIMGAGGATWGVLEPLLRERPAALVVVNRTVDRAVVLVDHFRKLPCAESRELVARPYEELRHDRFNLVINATSASLTGAMPPLPESVFEPDALAYDMVYGKDTHFLRFARAHGAYAADGLGMLVEQAAESFFIWRGARPATAPVIRELRRKAEG